MCDNDGAQNGLVLHPRAHGAHAKEAIMKQGSQKGLHQYGFVLDLDLARPRHAILPYQCPLVFTHCKYLRAAASGIS